MRVLNAVATAWRVLLLVAAISMTGCVSSYSYVQVPPAEAASVLQVGDNVEITGKDGSVELLKLREISDTELIGSDQTSTFGRKKMTIPVDDIAGISLSKKEGADAEGTIEAWSYLLILWPFFVF
jgi:hypothetical protein